MTKRLHRWFRLAPSVETTERIVPNPCSLLPDPSESIPYRRTWLLRSLMHDHLWEGPVHRCPEKPAKDNPFGVYGWKTDKECVLWAAQWQSYAVYQEYERYLAKCHGVPDPFHFAVSGGNFDYHQQRQRALAHFGDLVYAELDGHGRIVEHERGYRVEVACVQKLAVVRNDRLSPNDLDEMCRRLAERFQCPTGFHSTPCLDAEWVVALALREVCS